MCDRYDQTAAQLEGLVLNESQKVEWLAQAANLPPGFRQIVDQGLAVSVLEAGTLLHIARDLAISLSTDLASHNAAEFGFLATLISRFLTLWTPAAEHVGESTRRLVITFDLAGAVITGMIADRVIFDGFDVINGMDYTEWLVLHGAKHADSVVVRNLYDGCFAYRSGITPNLEAGTALRGQLKMLFDYKGAVAWRMRAGMGDTIFAPIYLLLEARGVKFQFFQRIKNLSLSVDHTVIDRIEIDVQATLRSAPYRPLVTVKGLACWPNQPDYAQLNEGADIRNYNIESWYTGWHDKLPPRTLTRGVHFDDVVLGISLGALPYICPEMIAARQSWRDMVSKVETVQTQSVQLWLTKTAQELGWEGGATLPENERALACGFVEPFDTYADFGHLIPRENWSLGDNVRQIAYFCNCLPQQTPAPAPFTDPLFPGRQAELVHSYANAFMAGPALTLWPNARATGGGAGVDPSIIRLRYERPNIDPPELYVLSVVGSSKYRLSPGGSGFSNLYLAGDWTLSGMNGGCVEGAVMSGLAAAQALVVGPASATAALQPTAAPPLGGNGDDIRRYWQEQAEAKLPPQSKVVARNAAVTATYADLYRRYPLLYKWAGLAAYASHRIGLLLLAYDFVPRNGALVAIERATGRPPALGVSRDLELLRRMNNDVYADIAWAHLAYEAPDAGLPAVLSGLQPLPQHEHMIEGFRQIDAGYRMLSDPQQATQGANMIWSGNRDLLYHEQNIILQPGYDAMDLSFNGILTVLASMDFNLKTLTPNPRLITLFTTFMLKEGLVILAQTGPPKIGNFRQRWFWISRSVFPLWRSIDAGTTGPGIAGAARMPALIDELWKTHVLAVPY
jgi:uncharacterized protein with NAD-binding domain and iron-sulfur cluster